MRQAAFDAYAASYDEHFTESAIGRMQRARVYNFLRKFVSGKKKILEINCGTGEDALWLARQGHAVTATDISAKMIEAGEKKKLNAGISNVDFFQKSFSQLRELNPDKYELVFSNFGGLNCVPPDELSALSVTLNELLSEEGFLFLVTMGRKCKWERFYFNRRGKPDLAERRKVKEGIEANVDSGRVKTWYYSPYEITEIFSSFFCCRSVKPVGLFIPPSYLNNYFRPRKKLLGALYLAEKLFGRFEFVSDYADHYAIVLQKRKKNT